MASSKYHVRSVSFPSRSHPSTARVEEHLDKLQTWLDISASSSSSSSSSDSLSNGVSMLEELYELVDELLHMGSTQQVLSQNQRDTHVESLLESSVRLLDACGVTRDILSQTNEHVREVQSAMRRRRKGDSSLEACVSSYVCFRKKAKRDAKKLVSTVTKQVDDKKLQEQDMNENNSNGHFVAVISVLRRVCAVTVLVFRSLLSFMAVSESTRKSNTKWALVAKLIHKGVIACEDQKRRRLNEFEKVDSQLVTVTDKLNIGEARRSLEALETRVNGIENGVEIVFRRLVKTRASLLNIISS